MANLRKCLFILLVLACSAVACATVATAAGQVSASDGIYQTHVTSVKLDPDVFFPYETGTITVTLTNSGNQTVTLSQPDILETHIAVSNRASYNTNVRLGPGSAMTYSFRVTVSGEDGTYFPVFTVSTVEAGSISYPFELEVDSKELDATIVDRPDNFVVGKKDSINLSLVNSRNGAITDIIITPSGNGVTVSPRQKFIATLPAGSSQMATFQVTPDQASNLTFYITYHNGNNDHSIDEVLPLNIGEDKMAAVPIVNNIVLISQGSSYKLTGDVNNAGITDAKSMVLTMLTPARPVEPYADYAIGSLASDDFSSFTLTFTSNDLSSVPMQITWKDADGNSFSTVKTLDLRYNSGSASSGTGTGSSGSSSSSGTAGSAATRTNTGGPPGGGSIFGFGGTRGGGLSSFYPVIALGIVIVVGIIIWMKRKWIAAKLKRK
jgi:archaellum component FlaF (FlaF/FlaG flagellin family)